MPSTGYIQIHAYASNAQIPLNDVAVTITDTSGSAIAMRLTNRNGLLNHPIEVIVPDLSASQSPNTGTIPFSTVNLYARHPGFEEIYINNLQIFPGIVTLQNLEMIPMSEYPESWNKVEFFNTTAQNL